MLENVLNYLGLSRKKVMVINSKKSGFTHIIVNSDETISFNENLGVLLLNHNLIPLQELVTC